MFVCLCHSGFSDVSQPIILHHFPVPYLFQSAKSFPHPKLHLCLVNRKETSRLGLLGMACLKRVCVCACLLAFLIHVPRKQSISSFFVYQNPGSLDLTKPLFFILFLFLLFVCSFFLLFVLAVLYSWGWVLTAPLDRVHRVMLKSSWGFRVTFAAMKVQRLTYFTIALVTH